MIKKKYFITLLRQKTNRHIIFDANGGFAGNGQPAGINAGVGGGQLAKNENCSVLSRPKVTS